MLEVVALNVVFNHIPVTIFFFSCWHFKIWKERILWNTTFYHFTSRWPSLRSGAPLRCRGHVSSPHFLDLRLTLVQKRRVPDAIYQDSLHNWMTLTIAIATFYNGCCFHSFYDVSACRLRALSFLNRFFRFINWICCTNLFAILSVVSNNPFGSW